MTEPWAGTVAAGEGGASGPAPQARSAEGPGPAATATGRSGITARAGAGDLAGQGSPAGGGSLGGAGGAAAPDRGRTNLAWALALLDGLVRAGVEHVVVCPGSRSTPLALAAARHPGVRLWVQLDERSAGFFALGLGRATGRPAAVVATSGTAPANFYPAVIEARYGRVPLVVLSADRPHELREFGASQTVDQTHLYGRHAKWFADLPLPEDDPAVQAYVARLATRAVAEALAAPAGPVHLNVPFREPLVPAAEGDEPARRGPAVAMPGGAVPAPRAAVEPRLAPAALTEGQADELFALLAGARRGLIVCGPLSPVLPLEPGAGLGGGGGAPASAREEPPLAASVLRLAARLGLPVLADPLSGLRGGHPAAEAIGPATGGRGGATTPAGTTPAGGTAVAVRPAGTLPAARTPAAGAADADAPVAGAPAGGATGRPPAAPPVPGSPLIDAYDAFLRDPDVAAALAPDVVLRLGGAPVSKPLAQFLERHRDAVQVIVDEGGWPDPGHVAVQVVRADPVRATAQLARRAEEAAGAGAGAAGSSRSWLALWQRLNAAARDAIARQLARWDEPAEPRVVDELARRLPEGAVLFAGNSMPVRDVDTFFPATPRRVRILANRGAAGIDGVVSTAAGVAASGEGPVVLLIGDLSFYHDLNGLWAAARYHLPLLAVVVNNDGGGIFSFLPQARLDPGEFEPLWGTPHGLDFRHAAALYGIGYRRVETWPDFAAAVEEALAGGMPAIVEIRTNRPRNVEHHRQVWEAVARAAKAVLAGAALTPPGPRDVPHGGGEPGDRAGAAGVGRRVPGGPAAGTGEAGRWDPGAPPTGIGGAGRPEPGEPPQGAAGAARREPGELPARTGRAGVDAARAGARADGGEGPARGPGPKGPAAGTPVPEGSAGTGSFTAAFVRVRGARYHVVASGGPGVGPGGAGVARPRPVGHPEPALLLHGFTGSVATWAGVWEALAEAGPLLAVDLLGHGRSAAPADPRRYRMEEQVADLLALLDRLAVERVHLVGYSMGGRVALSLAVAAPQRVASLVLESASPGLADPAEREARRRSDEDLARRIEEEGLEAFARSWEVLPLFAGLRRLPPAAQAAVRATRRAQRPRGLANSLRGMGAGVQPPLWDRLAGLRVPVLCLAGGDDAKYVALAQAMAERLPRGRAVVVPGAGHTVHLEEPAAFVKEVRAFWSEHR